MKYYFSRQERTSRNNRDIIRVFLDSLVICFLCCVFLGLSLNNSKGKSTSEKKVNVLLITLDTLRADRLGYSGYEIQTPHLDALAYGGTRCMNAVCQVPLTLPSHASILTGTNPPFHRIKNNGTYFLEERFTTLAEILKEEGYVTAAFIGAFPLASSFGLNQGFDFYDDTFKNPDHLEGYEPQRIASQVFESASEWFERNSGNRFFCWVHYYDPHLPYAAPPPYDKIYKSPYDGEVAYTDVYIGKLVKLLKEKNVYDTTLIVVVGDHGEGLGDHGEDTHGIFLYDTTLKVPLIFHSPGRIPEQLVVDVQVRTIDILPTILDVLNISAPGDCQGKSLVPLMKGDAFDVKSYAESYLSLLACGWAELKAVRTNRWKFIEAPKPELYDLVKDPEEEINLIESEKEVALELSRSLNSLEKSISLSSEAKPIRQITPEVQEKLAALGYVGSTKILKNNLEAKIDPKDKIQVFDGAIQAEFFLSRGDTEKARNILKNLSDQEPGNPLILHFLGKTYQKMEKWELSIQEFQKVLAINPDDVYSHFALASSFYQTGRKKEAVKEAKIVLSFLGEHFETLMLLARIFEEEGNFQESVVCLERATKLAPDNLDLRLLLADTLAIAKEYDKAVEQYKSLSKDMPDNPRVYKGLGMACYFKGSFEEAIMSFLKELELHANPRTLFFLGISYGRLNKYREAVVYLERYYQSLPPDDIEQREKTEAVLRFFKSKLD